MIYFTTFILTILLSHIARATPACGDVASPEKLYNPAIADAQQDQHTLLPIAKDNVRWTHKYDPNRSTKSMACSHLAPRYPLYGEIPFYPNIGGIWIVKDDPKFCGTCWNLTAVKTRKTIFIMVVDSSEPGWFDIPEKAFISLNNGPGISLEGIFKEVDGIHCSIKKNILSS
jgi:hypothetical protein